MDKILYSKPIRIGFCIAGMLFGILAISSRLLWRDSLESWLALLVPDKKAISLYLMLPTYLGIEMIFISSFILAYILNRRRLDYVFSKNYYRILLFLCGFFSLLALLISVNRSFDPDEFEHVHSTWYIVGGYIPYTDFFQNHNPLLWYSLSPFLLLFGYTVHSVLMLRILMFFLTSAIVYSTYRLSRKINGSKEVGLFSGILLLSAVMFVGRSIEIRPDVPQVFFGIVSVYALITYFKVGKLKYIIFSALSASLSFIFLQKTVFLLMAYALIFIYKFLKGKISFGPMVYFVICFSLPLSFFLAYLLLISGSLNNYFITNFTINITHSGNSFSPFAHLMAGIVLNGLFWLLSLLSLAYTFLSKRMNEEAKTVAFIASVLLASLFIVKHPYEQYFMQAIPLLCVVVGGAFDSLRRRYNANEMQSLIVILVVIAAPLLWLLHLGLHNTNNVQLDKANYVIQNSEEGDFVYDGSNQFNLYRHDLHYFWCTLGNLSAFNRLTNDKYGDYDICSLIESKKPTFISDYGLPMKECGLDNVYAKTRFDGLYVRREK